MKKKQIGVIGYSSCTDEVSSLAYEIGKEIASQNAILICGGRGGVMEGASKGCSENNGLVVGILPGHNEEDSIANPYLDIVIPTNMGWTRNSLVAMASDGIIVIGGKSGTLSEIAYGWMYDKPIVSLDNNLIPHDSWGRKLAGKKLDDRRSDKIWSEKNPGDAVSLLISKLKIKKSNKSKLSNFL